MSPALHEKKAHVFVCATLCLSLFFQLVSVKLCGARGDLARVGSSVLGAHTTDPSATNCSCHSE